MSKEDKRRVLLAAALDYATAVKYRADGLGSQDNVDRAAANLALCALDFAGSTSIYRAGAPTGWNDADPTGVKPRD